MEIVKVCIGNVRHLLSSNNLTLITADVFNTILHLDVAKNNI